VVFGHQAGHRHPMSDLHAAAYDADLDAVLACLSKGASSFERDHKGYTPLLWSCFRGAVGEQAPVAAALMAAGADPNAATTNGDSNCLILAVQAGAVPVIDALLVGGANVNAGADDVTPLMVAARDGDPDVVARLLLAGADPSIMCGSFNAAAFARHGGHDDLADELDQLTARSLA